MSLEGSLGAAAAPSSTQNAPEARRWERAFWLLAAAHFVVWTLLPAFTCPNAPLDVVEIVYWGHEWQWGYYKHPPLPSWLSEAAHLAAGTWGIYLLSQAAVVTAFWAVWRTAREMVGPRTAFFSVLLLECCPFYNLWTPEFNHGVCMCASWALAILCFYRAVDRGRSRDWVATGFCLGIGLLTKYNTATLIPGMLLFLAADRASRRHWRTSGPYLTMLVALALAAPHAWWALSHGCPGLSYVMDRTKSQPHILARVLDPLEFMGGQAGILLPAFAGLAPLVGFRFRLRNLSEVERRQRRLLVFVCLGPVACYLLISAILRMNLTAAYGTQLWLFAGLLALLCFELEKRSRNWRCSAAWCLGTATCIALSAGVCNFANPYLVKKASRIHFPGAALAQTVEDRWKGRFGVPLPIAAGEWWLAGNVSFYGPSRSSVYCGGPHDFSIDLIPAYSNWTSDDDLNHRGGVILWNAAEKGTEFPKVLEDRFPVREVQDPLELSFQTGAAIPPLCVGIAFIPAEARRSRYTPRALR